MQNTDRAPNSAAPNGAAPDAVAADEAIESAAGEVARPKRFGIGARATILLGMSVGVVVAAAPLTFPWGSHTTVSA